MSARLRHDDAGVTLVELIVAMVVGLLFLSLVAGLLVNGISAQAQTADRDTATGAATDVASSLQTSLRNASAVSPSSGTGNTLVALVATGSTGWQCRAWVLTSGGSLMYKSASAQFSTASTAGWTALATGITGSFSGGAMFRASSSTQLAYSFTLTVGSSTVPITGGVTAQAVMGSGGPCW